MLRGDGDGYANAKCHSLSVLFRESSIGKWLDGPLPPPPLWAIV